MPSLMWDDSLVVDSVLEVRQKQEWCCRWRRKILPLKSMKVWIDLRPEPCQCWQQLCLYLGAVCCIVDYKYLPVTSTTVSTSTIQGEPKAVLLLRDVPWACLSLWNIILQFPMTQTTLSLIIMNIAIWEIMGGRSLSWDGQSNDVTGGRRHFWDGLDSKATPNLVGDFAGKERFAGAGFSWKLSRLCTNVFYLDFSNLSKIWTCILSTAWVLPAFAWLHMSITLAVGCVVRYF